jgi:hypothetical protein
MQHEVRETPLVTGADVLAAKPRLLSVMDGHGFAIHTYASDDLPELQRVETVARGRPNKKVVYGTKYVVAGVTITLPPTRDRAVAAEAIADAINRYRANPSAQQRTPSTVTFGKKLILAVDFDGVIHRYSRGWQDGAIYDAPTPGFFEWAERVSEKFQLVVYSSRSGSEEGRAGMQEWLHRHAVEHYRGPLPEWVDGLQFAAEKPPAWLTIDDRCVRFDGSWSSHELGLSALLGYRSWAQRPD